MLHQNGPAPAGRRGPDLRSALDDVQRRHEDLQRALAGVAQAGEAEAGARAHAQAARFRTLLDTLPTGVVEFAAGQECRWANRAFLDLVGRQLDDVLGRGWHDSVHPGDRDRPHEGPGTTRFVRPDGSEVVCDVVPAAGSGAPDAALLVSVHPRATVVAAAAGAGGSPAGGPAGHGSFFDHAPLGSVVTDLDGVVQSVNAAYLEMTGFSREELVGHLLHEVVLPTTGVLDVPEFARSLHVGGGGRTLELQLLRRDRSVFWTRVSAFGALDERGCPVLVAQHVEVEDLRYHQPARREVGRHDELTGLPDRTQLLAALTDRLAQRYGHLTVLFCDLDRFKAVNDVLGHVAGDELLLQATERLRGRLRPGDVLARLGSDQFVLLLHGVDGEEAVTVAARVQRSFATSFLVQDEEVTCGLSIGVRTLDLAAAGDPVAATVIDDAQSALTAAKDAGRGNSQFFSPRMRDSAVRRVQVEHDLRHGIEAGELRVHYQPVVRLADGRRTGYEALVRWNHPERGLLLPAEFLDVAEESGLLRAVDTIVLREAVGFLSRHPGTHVGINVSPRRLDGSFAEAVLLQLARAGVEASRLSVELLETALLTVDSTTTRELQTLASAGCPLLIDDFGTGYSALSYLRRLPVTGLKLDRSFVADLPHDENADRIASAVAGLATGFGLHSVAEGVESAEQAEHLRAQGWTSAQGWFFGRPAPEEAWYPAAVRVAGVALAS